MLCFSDSFYYKSLACYHEVDLYWKVLRACLCTHKLVSVPGIVLTEIWATDLSVPAKHWVHICQPAAGPALVWEEGRVSRSDEGLAVYC